MMKQSYHIDGMTCQACATRLERVMGKKAGVQSASVNFASENLVIESEAPIALEQVQAWATAAGFSASIPPESIKPVQAPRSPIPYTLFVLVALSLVVHPIAWHSPLWLQCLVSSFVQLVFAIPFYTGAYRALKGRMANMDVLIALGTTLIWVFSTSVYLLRLVQDSPHEAIATTGLYFDANVMIITFIRIGKYLEARVKHQSLDSIAMLKQLMPAQVQRRDGAQWVTVPIDAVQKGDVLQARTGDRIAADGVVLSGSGVCDESHLTGEAIGIEKADGAAVMAGSILSSGLLQYRVEKAGAQTVLGDIIHAVNQAQGSKAPIARIADTVAGVFVPVVVGIAVLTFLLNWLLAGHSTTISLVNAVSVLVIACPCALGLATPAAIMASMGTATRWGIMFKDAAVMERTAKIDTLVFDKTGTLTEGHPSLIVTSLAPEASALKQQFPGLLTVAQADSDAGSRAGSDAASSAGSDGAASTPADATQVQADSAAGSRAGADAASSAGSDGAFNDVLTPLKALAASIEVNTNHPLAQAFLPFLPAEPLALEEVKTIAGEGVHAQWQGHAVRLGRPAPDTGVPTALSQAHPECTWIELAIDGRPVAYFGVADALKTDAVSGIQALHKAGLSVHILSGDTQSAVAHVAQQVGVRHYQAALKPLDKSNTLSQLQAQGHVVGMVGDGINDAVALSCADVSFAPYHSSAIAQQTAQVTLLNSDVQAVSDAVYLSRATLHNIKQNLFFAFVYNCIGIPVAAFGLLTPNIASLCMAMSSVSVLFNALRLKRLKNHK